MDDQENIFLQSAAEYTKPHDLFKVASMAFWTAALPVDLPGQLQTPRSWNPI